ncbi:MAG: hypothetical protein AAB834_00400 [Patescibacteria group bacterium]
MKRLLKNASLFGILCSLVAIGYIGYRAYLVAGPKGLEGRLGSEGVAATVTLGCKHDNAPKATPAGETFPIITSTYQDMIHSASHLGKNLVPNASLEASDKGKKNPNNFSHITDNTHTDYVYLNDPIDNLPFLRVVNTKGVNVKETAGGWIMNPVAIQPDSTYAYSFEYRSTVPIMISLEYIMPDGTTEYQNVTKVEKKEGWERFTAHIHNFKGVAAFRFVVVSREAGRVDTRSYDIHRIASETLKQGIVSITFDDGWQSVYDKAIPILDAYH